MRRAICQSHANLEFGLCLLKPTHSLEIERSEFSSKVFRLGRKSNLLNPDRNSRENGYDKVPQGVSVGSACQLGATQREVVDSLSEKNSESWVDGAGADGCKETEQVLPFAFSIDCIASLAKIEKTVELGVLLSLALFGSFGRENLACDTLPGAPAVQNRLLHDFRPPGLNALDFRCLRSGSIVKVRVLFNRGLFGLLLQLLGLHHSVVRSLQLEKRIMIPDFQDLTRPHDEDLVGISDCAETVGNLIIKV